MHVCMHVCMHVYMRVCMYICTYVRMYVHSYMYVGTYVCTMYGVCMCIQKHRLESEIEQQKREHKREIDQQKRENDQQKRVIDQQKREIDQKKKEIDRLQKNLHRQWSTKQPQPKQPMKPSAKKVGHKAESLHNTTQVFQPYCTMCIFSLCKHMCMLSVFYT